MFELCDTPILIPVTKDLHPHAGGVVTFAGHVRAFNEGKIVTALDYEVYPKLALSEGNKVLQEAKQKFSLLHAHAIHRYGHLKTGDMAVWVCAVSMHRREAFQAAEFIIHSIKHRVPIWKKEQYETGVSEWVQCHHTEQAS